MCARYGFCEGSISALERFEGYSGSLPLRFLSSYAILIVAGAAGEYCSSAMPELVLWPGAVGQGDIGVVHVTDIATAASIRRGGIWQSLSGLDGWFLPRWRVSCLDLVVSRLRPGIRKKIEVDACTCSSLGVILA